MALDQATTDLMAQMAEQGVKPLHEMTVTEARGLTAGLSDMYGPGPDVARAEDLDIPADHATIPARLLVPEGTPRGVVVYFHGGGWVIGALPEFETLCRKLAVASGYAVVSVDYRMAPEHPYPAAVQDAWTALRWIDENLDQLAGARVPLVVMGDSSGGNLAAVVAQQARDAGGPSLAMQVLVYPVTDSNVNTETYTDPANQLLLSRDSMIWFFDLYTPDATTRGNADLCPARASDLSGLPPALVLTAEHDVLRQEGEAYVDALRAAGNEVTHQRFDGQMHGFFTLPNVLPGSDAALDVVVGALDRLSTTQTT
jgi:acetyl esterase